LISVSSYEFTELIIEKLQGFIYGVKNNPDMPDDLFKMFADSHNFGSSEKYKMVLIIYIDLMFSLLRFSFYSKCVHRSSHWVK